MTPRKKGLKQQRPQESSGKEFHDGSKLFAMYTHRSKHAMLFLISFCMLSKVPPAFNETLFQDLSQGWLPKTRVQQQDSDLNSAIASSIQVFEYSLYLYC